jgi:hypothetical protein
MNVTQMQSRKERREAAKQLTVSTHHNGRFGVWSWDVLSKQEQEHYMEAQKRNQYVQLFGVYA